MNGFNRAYFSACTTICALVWIDYINVPFGNCFNRALINTGATCGTVVCNNVSHFYKC